MEIQKYSRKLDLPLRMKVLAMMARGEKYQTIIDVLKEQHDIEYSKPGLVDLKKRHADTIAQMQAMIIDAEASDAEQIRAKSLRLLSRRLDRATEDELELDELDHEYREGKISLAEYRQKKTGYIKLNIQELTIISREMFSQNGRRSSVKGIATTNPTDGDAEPTDPNVLEALMLAIQRGDTIALQKLTINPNA